MNGRYQILLAIGAGALGIGLLVYASIQASARQFVHPGELARSPATYDGRRIKLSGQVVADSPSYNQQNLKLRFRVKDKQGAYSASKSGSYEKTEPDPSSTEKAGSAPEVNVRYQGPKPDAFKEGGIVILEGVYHRDGNWIETRTLQAKCPSRYKKKSKGKGGDGANKEPATPES